jgi:dTDP-4-dehydrorhamnose 3,5-epimerase-like enzyme
MPGRFVDERGVILDLLGPVDAVTRIITNAGAKRGSHVHERTQQWTLVLSGRLRVVTIPWRDGELVHRERDEKILTAGGMCTEPAGLAHAWEALEDTDVLVFARGPRAGENYEEDTLRFGPFI